MNFTFLSKIRCIYSTPTQPNAQIPNFEGTSRQNHQTYKTRFNLNPAAGADITQSNPPETSPLRSRTTPPQGREEVATGRN